MVDEEIIKSIDEQKPDQLNSMVSDMIGMLHNSQCRQSAIESQNWYQRMAYTITGKNKATIKELQLHQSAIQSYIAETVAVLCKRDRIEYQMIVNLLTIINNYREDQLDIGRYVEQIIKKLNEKVESYHKSNILMARIDHGYYSEYMPMVAVCLILFEYDEYIVRDKNQLEVLQMAIKDSNIIDDDEKSAYEILEEFTTLSEKEIPIIRLSLNVVSDDPFSIAMLSFIEEYYSLNDEQIENSKIDQMINHSLRKHGIDPDMRLSSMGVYDRLLETRKKVLMLHAEHRRLVEADKLYREGFRMIHTPNADWSKALKILEESAEKGNGKAAYEIAVAYHPNMTSKEEWRWLEKASELGDINGVMLLVSRYEFGIKTEKSTEKAKQILRKFILGNYDGRHFACYKLGTFEWEEKHYKEAVSLFQEALTGGDWRANHYLGKAYENGYGLYKNRKAAFECYLAYAEKESFGKIDVGRCFHFGIGTEKNETEAKKWLVQAAQSIDLEGDEARKLIKEYYGDHVEIKEVINQRTLTIIQKLCNDFLENHPSKRFKSSEKLTEVLKLDGEIVYLIYDSSNKCVGEQGFSFTDHGITCKEFKDEKLNYTTWMDFRNSQDDLYYRRSKVVTLGTEKKLAVCYIKNDKLLDDLGKLLLSIQMECKYLRAIGWKVDFKK